MEYVIGLGSNLGSREAHLRVGLELLAETAGCVLIACSSVYESEPLGPPQPRYLNAAARVASELAPHALLARLLEIERLLGRERRERWGARTLDLDILWAEVALDSPELQIPHRGLMQRWFALAPAAEVAPELAAAPSLPPAGRRLHALTLQPGAQQRATAGEWTVVARGLDHADALAAVLSAAAQAACAQRPGTDCEVELLRVDASAAAQPALLLVALNELCARGVTPWRVLVSARDERALQARALGIAREGSCNPFGRATLALDDGPQGARATLRVERPR